jgi:hypothetical protein
MPAEYGYDMPQRYCGKENAYGDDPFEQLAGNNSTRIPPYKQKKVCGLGKTAFGSSLASLALVISGGVAGVLGALVSARLTSGYISRMFNR